jgi:hypothetical protein
MRQPYRRNMAASSSESDPLGDKKSLERKVHKVTGVAVGALKGSAIFEFTVAELMSWGEKRETSAKKTRFILY